MWGRACLQSRPPETPRYPAKHSLTLPHLSPSLGGHGTHTLPSRAVDHTFYNQFFFFFLHVWTRTLRLAPSRGLEQRSRRVHSGWESESSSLSSSSCRRSRAWGASLHVQDRAARPAQPRLRLLSCLLCVLKHVPFTHAQGTRPSSYQREQSYAKLRTGSQPGVTLVHLATSGDIFQVSLLDGRCAGILWAKMPTKSH